MKTSMIGRRTAAATLLATTAFLLASCGGSTTEDPPPPPCPTVAGTWSGTLAEATSGSFGEAVIALEQTGCALSGSWNARFNSGTVNSGTISGTVVANTQIIDFRLTSTGPGQCPISVTVSALNGEAQGTYASVNCPVLLAGNVHVYRDAPAGPGYHPAVPATPSGVVATAGNGQVTLRWTKVFGASAHNVYWSTSPGVTPGTGTKVAQVNEPATITGLSSATPHYFVVTAENAGGEGATSVEVSAAPSFVVPNAPTSVGAVAGIGQVTVTWPQVSGATGYNLYWGTSPGQAFSGGTRVALVSSPYTFTGLANGTTYYFAVTASNPGGESAASAEAGAATPVVLAPNPPTAVQATAGDGQASVSWGAVPGATGYNLYWSTNSGEAFSSGTKVTGVSSSYNLAGLNNGATYYIALTATNAGGERAPSTAARATPTVAPPGAPAGLAATPGIGQVTLTWGAASGATGYNVYWSASPGQAFTSGTRIAGAFSPIALTGLAGGTNYYFVVTAVNTGGESPPSAESSAAPVVPIPNAPTGIVAVPANGQVTVTWPAVGGATGYNVYWGWSPGQAFRTGMRSQGVSSPQTLTGLTNGTTYFVAVTATNAGGESAPSVEARATPYEKITYDFEGGAISGWTATGSWGIVSSTAHSGGYAVADSPGADYANNSDSSLTSAPFSLRSRTVYVASGDVGSATGGYANYISQYRIDPNGALLPLSPATVATGTEPVSVTVDPSGRYAYVVNGFSNDVSQYTVGSDGLLTVMMPPTVAAGGAPQGVTVDPSGRYVYVANFGHCNILQYTIGSDGALTPMLPATVSAGCGTISVTVDPHGRFAYAAVDAGVAQFSIGANGRLTPLVPATVPAGTFPVSVAIDPLGRYAYVANFSSGDVSQYVIGADGALTPMVPATIAAGTMSTSVAIDRTGRFAYVTSDLAYDSTCACYQGRVSEYAIGANGALTPLTPAHVLTNSHPTSITFDPSGRYAYVATPGGVSQYTVGTSGVLTRTTDAMATFYGGWSVAANPYNGSPMLTFWHRYELEFGRDFGRVEISSDAGATWTTLRTFTGSQTEWTAETVSLRDYAAPDVRIRFRLTSDGSGTADGWYLDDIVIYK